MIAAANRDCASGNIRSYIIVVSIQNIRNRSRNLNIYKDGFSQLYFKQLPKWDLGKSTAYFHLIFGGPFYAISLCKP